MFENILDPVDGSSMDLWNFDFLPKHCTQKTSTWNTDKVLLFKTQRIL